MIYKNEIAFYDRLLKLQIEIMHKSLQVPSFFLPSNYIFIEKKEEIKFTRYDILDLD